MALLRVGNVKKTRAEKIKSFGKGLVSGVRNVAIGTVQSIDELGVKAGEAFDDVLVKGYKSLGQKKLARNYELGKAERKAFNENNAITKFYDKEKSRHDKVIARNGKQAKWGDTTAEVASFFAPGGAFSKAGKVAKLPKRIKKFSDVAKSAKVIGQVGLKKLAPEVALDATIANTHATRKNEELKYGLNDALWSVGGIAAFEGAPLLKKKYFSGLKKAKKLTKNGNVSISNRKTLPIDVLNGKVDVDVNSLAKKAQEAGFKPKKAIGSKLGEEADYLGGELEFFNDFKKKTLSTRSAFGELKDFESPRQNLLRVIKNSNPKGNRAAKRSKFNLISSLQKKVAPYLDATKNVGNFFLDSGHILSQSNKVFRDMANKKVFEANMFKTKYHKRVDDLRDLAKAFGLKKDELRVAAKMYSQEGIDAVKKEYREFFKKMKKLMDDAYFDVSKASVLRLDGSPVEYRRNYVPSFMENYLKLSKKAKAEYVEEFAKKNGMGLGEAKETLEGYFSGKASRHGFVFSGNLARQREAGYYFPEKNVDFFDALERYFDMAAETVSDAKAFGTLPVNGEYSRVKFEKLLKKVKNPAERKRIKGAMNAYLGEQNSWYQRELKADTSLGGGVRTLDKVGRYSSAISSFLVGGRASLEDIVGNPYRTMAAHGLNNVLMTLYKRKDYSGLIKKATKLGVLGKNTGNSIRDAKAGNNVLDKLTDFYYRAIGMTFSARQTGAFHLLVARTRAESLMKTAVKYRKKGKPIPKGVEKALFTEFSLPANKIGKKYDSELLDVMAIDNTQQIMNGKRGGELAYLHNYGGIGQAGAKFLRWGLGATNSQLRVIKNNPVSGLAKTAVGVGALSAVRNKIEQVSDENLNPKQSKATKGLFYIKSSPDDTTTGYEKHLKETSKRMYGLDGIYSRFTENQFSQGWEAASAAVLGSFYMNVSQFGQIKSAYKAMKEFGVNSKEFKSKASKLTGATRDAYRFWSTFNDKEFSLLEEIKDDSYSQKGKLSQRVYRFAKTAYEKNSPELIEKADRMLIEAQANKELTLDIKKEGAIDAAVVYGLDSDEFSLALRDKGFKSSTIGAIKRSAIKRLAKEADQSVESWVADFSKRNLGEKTLESMYRAGFLTDAQYKEIKRRKRY